VIPTSVDGLRRGVRETASARVWASAPIKPLRSARAARGNDMPFTPRPRSR